MHLHLCLRRQLQGRESLLVHVGARKTGAEVRSCFVVSRAVSVSDSQENEECSLTSSCRGAAITKEIGDKAITELGHA